MTIPIRVGRIGVPRKNTPGTAYYNKNYIDWTAKYHIYRDYGRRKVTLCGRHYRQRKGKGGYKRITEYYGKYIDVIRRPLGNIPRRRLCLICLRRLKKVKKEYLKDGC